MIWTRRQWKAIDILLNEFGIELQQTGEFYREYRYRGYYLYDCLEILESRVEELLSERGKEFFYELSPSVIRAVKSLTYSELASISHGIDYNLELRSDKEVISEDNYSTLYYCLVTLPKYSDEGLINENHGMGYHIHYVSVEKKRQKRTNVVLTFNPLEVAQNQHLLYWENHGSGLKKDPSKFGNRRRNAIYDTSCSFLNRIAKQDFRSPATKSEVLWPL
ncbi:MULTISPECIES: hypothetical protein [Vibrio harveyi group]|uniref:hypothetical protein n=1 Tax=Vibrio harveyi group TaxID=717610 RepID=UPI001B83B500|nr:hypothetical protein [Vibrio alginolyticus]HCG5923576.1 hypothetical protein [Vibrio parahaemolyticus]EGR1564750.1 hypothetical protein [Vibrio alginolyticus]EIL8370777.1 hypothetical protein [Vibrio alginolyticus]EIO9265590.1 hypothetical protein [Vibrio alginolyticus]ELB2874358.1 hypothetical protein [Vibrio alginolyticus]